MEIVIHNFDRLPIRYMAYHVKIPLGFEKISFISESISWDMTMYYVSFDIKLGCE